MPPDVLEGQPSVDSTPPQPPIEATPEPVTAAPVDPDAALDAEIDGQTVDIPGSDPVVPLPALINMRTKLRGELKEAKAQLAAASEAGRRAEALERDVAALRDRLSQVEPYVAAYQEIQQRQAPQPPEDTTELEEIATDFQLYTPEGQLDLTRAKRIQARESGRAERIAKQMVAPIASNAVAQAAAGMLQRALVTRGENGEAPDPAVLRAVWSRLDPALTSTVDGAKIAWTTALGATAATRKSVVSKAPIPDPLVTERAGGREATATIAMTEADRRTAKAVGMTEEEYQRAAAEMPWARRA